MAWKTGRQTESAEVAQQLRLELKEVAAAAAVEEEADWKSLDYGEPNRVVNIAGAMVMVVHRMCSQFRQIDFREEAVATDFASLLQR